MRGTARYNLQTYRIFGIVIENSDSTDNFVPSDIDFEISHGR